MGDGDDRVRLLARLVWSAQDDLLSAQRGALHREDRFELVAPVPPPGTELVARTEVASAERRSSRRHGTVTDLVVVTRLLAPDGAVVAVGWSTSVLGAAPWEAALAS